MEVIHYLEKGVNCFFAILPRIKPPSKNLQNAQLIAHRGAHNTSIIENTLAAFQRALELRCWGIEFDVQCTVDNVLVVHHDLSLQRLWGIKKFISALTFKELKQLVPLIPSLSEVVDQFGQKLHLFVELKTPIYNEAALFTTLNPLKPEQDYHLISLDESIFVGMTLFSKTSCLLVANHNNVSTFCDISIKKKYGGVLGHYLLLNNKKIHTLRQANQKIGVGFVDSKFSLYRELSRDLRWIFTNKTERISSFLAPYGSVLR